MTGRSGRRWGLVGAILVMVLVAWGGSSWWTDDDQVRQRFVSSVREHAGVTNARDDDGWRDVNVRMRRDASVAQVVAVARQALETECCRLVIDLGAARMYAGQDTIDRDGERARGELLTRLGQVEFPGSIQLPSPGGRLISLDPQEPGGPPETQFAAAGDVLEVLGGVSSRARAMVDSVLGDFRGAQSVVMVGDAQDSEVRRRAERLLDVAAGLNSLDSVRVASNARDIKVTSTVSALGEVPGRWGQLARALRPVPGVRLEIAVPAADQRSLTVRGPAATTPGPALDLVQVATRSGARPSTVWTDLSYLDVDTDSPQATGRLAAALAPRVPSRTRLVATWGEPYERAAGNRISDRVDVVVQLAPRLASLARQRYVVGWDGPGRRLVSRPERVHPGALRRDQPELRRMVEQIRAVGWPGEARLELPMGASDAVRSCADEARAVSLRSMADGPGRDFEKLGCADEADVRALRAAWNATGGPGAG